VGYHVSCGIVLFRQRVAKRGIKGFSAASLCTALVMRHFLCKFKKINISAKPILNRSDNVANAGRFRLPIFFVEKANKARIVGLHSTPSNSEANEETY
jgi:hypothetical protein